MQGGGPRYGIKASKLRLGLGIFDVSVMFLVGWGGFASMRLPRLRRRLPRCGEASGGATRGAPPGGLMWASLPLRSGSGERRGGEEVSEGGSRRGVAMDYV